MTKSLDAVNSVIVINQPNNDFDIFGRNEDVGTVEEDVRELGGTMILNSSAFVVSVVSSSVEDSGAGGVNPLGTGIQQVTIDGVDANGNFQQVDLVLDGTTAVTTTETWLRINTIIPKNGFVGSNNAAVGNIDATLNGNNQARISIGNNETQQTNHMIPLDRNEKMSRFYLNSFGGKLVTARLLFKKFSESHWRNLRTLQLQDGHIVVEIQKIFPPGTDLKWVAFVDVAGGTMTAGYDFQFLGSKRELAF